jgi:hypothetical protein
LVPSSKGCGLMFVRGRSIQPGGRYRGFGFDGKSLFWGPDEVTVEIPEQAFLDCQMDPVVVIYKIESPPSTEHPKAKK